MPSLCLLAPTASLCLYSPGCEMGTNPLFAPPERAEALLTNTFMALTPQEEDAEEAGDKQAPGDEDL